MSEQELKEAFDRFETALHAAGGATAGLFIQKALSRDPFGARGPFYRVAQKTEGQIEYPFGEKLYRAGELAQVLRVATAALRLVPEGDTPL